MEDDETYDVIIVGFGDAGASAAIEAADRGARVLVLDRAYGGGSSALSGGVVYAGGGTRQQQEAGYDETPEDMFDYLRQEVRGTVSDATLRRFCEQSPGMIEWLESHGAEYKGSLAPYKTSYPTDDYYLYYSGNEKAHPYAQHAKPAPRGHRTFAPGLSSGKRLWTRLSQAALARGVTFTPLARVHELIVEDARVVGVRYRALSGDQAAIARHRKLTQRSGKLGNWFPPLARGMVSKAERLWQEGAVSREARATGGVVLAAGGFIYNTQMVAAHAPEFTKLIPLGTPGDDGAGIALGVSVGGRTALMDKVAAWRFLSPPTAFMEGVTVGLDGSRIANEDLYGATHSDVLVREYGGDGRAVFDSTQWRKAKSQLKTQFHVFQKLQAYYLFTIGHKKAGTIDALARKIGVDPVGLKATVDAYNEGLSGGAGDPAHKSPDNSSPILAPPFYAIDISVENAPFFPVPGLTLGGLAVDEESGEVLRQDDEPIAGLYAAGRNAAGICSNSYLSGLSLADCVFSGRRAGDHAAGAARRAEPAPSGRATE